MKLLRVEKLMYIYIKMSRCGLLQNLLHITGHGRTETGALFPNLSPPLPPLYIPSLLHFPPLFQSPLLHCFPALASLFGFPESTATHRTSTRSQEHGK